MALSASSAVMPLMPLSPLPEPRPSPAAIELCALVDSGDAAAVATFLAAHPDMDVDERNEVRRVSREMIWNMILTLYRGATYGGVECRVLDPLALGPLPLCERRRPRASGALERAVAALGRRCLLN
jgi:hypothetical protein